MAKTPDATAIRTAIRLSRVARRACLIVNPAAGGGRAARALGGVRDALGAHGIEHRAQLTTDLDHARVLAREAAAAGEVAVALGGDGLVGAVADALRATDGVLGVLPGGRGNDFARTLKIPFDPGVACAVLAQGVPRALDLAEVDGRSYVGIASVGFDSEANRIANASRISGNAVYLYAALRALASWRPAEFEIELDGERRAFRGYTVAAANARAYGGGMFLAPEADLQDGLLDVVLIGAVSRARFLTRLPQVFGGRHVGNPEVTVLRARSLTVHARRPLTMYADGDPIADLPATVHALPGAVRVLCPA
jgi:YegS/Rv2252/BmrU family lipid kinase